MVGQRAGAVFVLACHAGSSGFSIQQAHGQAKAHAQGKQGVAHIQVLRFHGSDSWFSEQAP